MSTARGAVRLLAGSQRTVAGLLLMLGFVYLVPFVARGWVPLDEGMIGQAAERVMIGELPHVDYEEPYPGALSYFYAAIFRLTGIDSVHLRWTVFGAAVATLWTVFVILRRMLAPVSAALATLVALAWTFPNYFSSLPSWWLLLCALLCLWCVVRYLETERLAFAAAAGFAVGMAFTIKQTGIYLLPPLAMTLMACDFGVENTSAARRTFERIIRTAVAITALALVILVTQSALGSGELLYLVGPVAACGIAFSLWDYWEGSTGRLNWQATVTGGIAATIPVAILLLPHVVNGSIDAFINGVFVLPQKRLEFTTLPMRPASLIVAAIVGLLWVLWSPTTLKTAEIRIVDAIRWVLAIALALAATRSHLVYTFLWEAVRGIAALLPFIAAWLIASGRISSWKQRRLMFASASLLAFASLGQFPFAAPVYFLYVAPLALIAGVIAVNAAGSERRLSDGPATAAVLLFALLSLNRGYVWNAGWFPKVHELSTPLELERAQLYVAEYEAAIYNRLIPLVQQHLGERGLVSGPDTPEVYFLTGQFSPSGRLFDFFSAENAHSEEQSFMRWANADVIVLFHGRRFSHSLPEKLIGKLRQEYPQAEWVAPFEVRWR